MTDLPNTRFYDSEVLRDHVNHGVKQGIEWMRERVIKMLMENPDMEPICEFYASCVRDINADDFFKEKK